MRYLLPIIIACLTLTARASDRITLTVTVTNTPAGHDEFTVNADTRLWTNSASATPQSLITIGASVGASATNLFRQIAAYRYSGPLDLGFSSSNVITLRGQAAQSMTASIVGTWASLSYSTNAVAPLTVVRVPLSSELTVYTQTNNATLLALGMGSYSLEPFAAGTTLLDNIVQTSGSQTIGGGKTFTDGAEFDTVLTLSGSAVSINNSPYYELYEEDQAADARRWRIYAQGNSLRIAELTDAGTATDIVTLSRSGGFEATGTSTMFLDSSTVNDSSFSGTITHGGEMLYSRANHTSLANGNNAAMALGETVYTKIKAGPTAAFAICGIAGGADGRMIVLQNATGQNMTISNDSGVDPTAANRIYTQTGSDVATTGNGTATLIYDSEDSRWILVSIQQ